MTDESDPPGDPEAARHARKMAKKKAARERLMAGRTDERGLVLVHTGKGKGKSTAAFGLVLRALGHAMNVGIVQFIKGQWDTGERAVLDRFPDRVRMVARGDGFTWETQDRDRDTAAVQHAWDEAAAMIADPDIPLVVLDEINVVLRYGYLATDRVLEALAGRPADSHVVLTGRNAPQAILDAADLVTEMELVRHPFRDGVKAQAGIEY